MQNEQIRYDAFISHASQDKTEAYELCAFLEKRGLSCWIAPRNVRPSRDYSEEIIEGVVNSKSLILLLSEHVEGASFVKREVERASSYNRKIFTIRLQDVSIPRSLELFLGLPHWIDQWAADYPERLEAIIAEINNTSGSAGSIKSASFVEKLRRFVAKNTLGIISAAILLFFAVFFISQRFSQPEVATPLESIADLDTSNFNMKVSRPYTGSDITLQLNGFSGRVMMSPAINAKQYEFTFEFDNGQRTSKIQTLMGAEVKIDESLPIATEVTVTLRDLETDAASDSMTFPIPQLQKIFDQGNQEKFSKLKGTLNQSNSLNCSVTLANTRGFMLCQIGQFLSGETQTNLQGVVNKITLGYSQSELNYTVFIDPLKAVGDLIVRTNEKDQLTFLLPRLTPELFYQYHFADGDTSPIKKTAKDINATYARELTSNNDDAPAVFLSTASNRISSVLAPVSNQPFSKVTWSIYPGIDNDMSLSYGFFHTEDISNSDIENMESVNVSFFLKNGDKATYTYQFEQEKSNNNARLAKMKANPQSLIDCNWTHCRFTWMKASQQDIDLIEDILIGLDARDMRSITNDDMKPLIAQMEKRRQPLYQKEFALTESKPKSELSFGTPINIGGPTLLQRLNDTSEITINSSWKQQENTRTSPIFHYSWPISPLFIQIKWKDGTSSKPLIYKVPFE